MEPLNNPEAFDALVEDYLNGVLDEPGRRMLEERLRTEPAARQRFVRYARMHTDLHREMRASQASARVLASIDRELQELLPAPSAGRARVLRRGFLMKAAAAVLFLGLGWLALVPHSSRDNGAGREATVAWLINAQNCKWAGDVEPTGDMKGGTVLKLERGLVEMRFQCGARLVLEGPANLELLSGKSARLVSGKLTARVPASGSGFEVLSPQGKVIDLGTEFGLAVSDNGSTDVYVFEGKVEAHPGNGGVQGGVSLTRNQAARMAEGRIKPIEQGAEADRFVRAIVPPPLIVARPHYFTFDKSVADSISDANGLGTGLTHRLPGTGGRIPENDPNLRLDLTEGWMELTTTRSDIRGQSRLWQGEYLGVRLINLGFTGAEDFEVTATIPNTPALEDYGQFGLYAGTQSDRNIRGGLIKWGRRDPGQNTQFLVNNDGGEDTDLYKVGLLSPGTSLRLTLKRTAGKYSLTVENLTDGGASTLSIRHPEFLDGERDLYVGLFGANPYSDVRKTLTVKEFSVTVWTASNKE